MRNTSIHEAHVQIFYRNLPEFGIKVKVGITVQFVNKVTI